MNQFDRLSNNKSLDIEKDETVYGCFACQRCSDDVDEAKYNFETKMLYWRCKNNHLSIIEEFDL